MRIELVNEFEVRGEYLLIKKDKGSSSYTNMGNIWRGPGEMAWSEPDQAFLGKILQIPSTENTYKRGMRVLVSSVGSIYVNNDMYFIYRGKVLATFSEKEGMYDDKANSSWKIGHISGEAIL